MSANAPPVLRPGDLNETDEEILDLLHAGRVTPPYIADELDKSREYASERLIRLKEHGNARRIAPGLYELIEDPRDDADAGDQGELAAQIEAVRERLAAAVEAIDQNDPEELKRNTRAAYEAAGGDDDLED